MLKCNSLVIGANGDIGCNLIWNLIQGGDSVIGVSSKEKQPIKTGKYTHIVSDYTSMPFVWADNVYFCHGNPRQQSNDSLSIWESHYLPLEMVRNNSCAKHAHYISSTQVLNSKGYIAPKNAYGIIKNACEKFVENNYDRYSIYRVCGLVSVTAKGGMITNLVRDIREKEKVLLSGKRPGNLKQYVSMNRLIATVRGNPTAKVVNCVPNDAINSEELVHYISDQLKIWKPIEWDNKDSHTFSGDLVVAAAPEDKQIGFAHPSTFTCYDTLGEVRWNEF